MAFIAAGLPVVPFVTVPCKVSATAMGASASKTTRATAKREFTQYRSAKLVERLSC